MTLSRPLAFTKKLLNYKEQSRQHRSRPEEKRQEIE